MTKFEDQLFSDLMATHSRALDGARRAAAARRRPRQVWLASGAVGAAGAITAGAMALGGTPAYAAYAVTPHADGSVSVSVWKPSGVPGANAALRHLHARVAVVPVRPGCPSVSSLPRPTPPVHLTTAVAAGIGKDGHRSVRVAVGKPGIPDGDTLLLAFSGTPGPGRTILGGGGLITGPVPKCVSLPSVPPPGSGGAGTSGGGAGTSGPGSAHHAGHTVTHSG